MHNVHMLDTLIAGSANLHASTSSPETEPQPSRVEQAVLSDSLHVLAITGEYDDQYGWRYTATYSTDGETLRQTTFSRGGRHDEFAVVGGGHDLPERDWRFGEIVDLIIAEAEDKSQAELYAANLRRASAWLAFREGGEEDADAMLPRTVEVPILSMREIADEWLREQAMRQGGV